MEYFLQRIARDIHDRYGDDLRDHCLVFPGRRSGIFFLKYLSAEIKRPVWAPPVMTINEYFRSLSDLIPAENEILLFELFKAYRTISKTTENFDDFYFWGDIILNDFDDADKYLADASKLFRNVRDLKEIEALFGGLTEEEVTLVKRFWVNFEPAIETKAKERFIAVWSVLEKLYPEFRLRLFAKNLAYEGMIFRSVAEDPDFHENKGHRWKMVHFIGFNALNDCEKRVMLKLKESKKARFYWDYDNSYIGENGYNSAGFFLKKNIKIFGNDMPPDWNYDTLVSGKPGKSERTVIETSSDIAQVKLIPGLLAKLPNLDKGSAHNTAVVLADENLLIPLLSCLPPEIPDINITMGFPLKQTTAYLLVKQLLALQHNAELHDGVVFFRYTDVVAVLKNELIFNLLDESDRKIPEEIIEHNMVYVDEEYFSGSEKLAFVFERKTTPSGLCDYVAHVLSVAASRLKELPDSTMPGNVRSEFIYRIILALNRLRPLTEDKEVTMSVDIWTRLLDRILRLQTVSFSGEPLSGIQIMGVLETRTLDFKNLIMISVNEGVIPSATTASSFIPFSLRQAFGLPSINHRESIYAYHFYRLLHRAENVTFLYNSNPEGLRSGEMSRFLLQLKYSPDTAPDFRNVGFEIKNPVSVSGFIDRTPEHITGLLDRYASGVRVSPLSPSAVNTWLNCRLRFYYRYVNGLREPEKIMTEIDPAALGSMVHAALRRLYTPFTGKMVGADEIAGIIDDKENIINVTNASVDEVLKRKSGFYLILNELMVKEVLGSYIGRILEMDRISAPFTIISMETQYYFDYPGTSLFNGKSLKVGGSIDRVDSQRGIIRILDYKTGVPSEKVKSLAGLFEEDRDRGLDAWLQTLIYCEAFLPYAKDVAVRPSVYKIRRIPGSADADKMILGNEALEDYTRVREEFLMYFKSLTDKIFSIDEPFVMTAKRNKCSFCPFRVLCRR